MTNESILEQINRSALRFLQPLTSQKTYAVIIEEACKLVDGEMGYMVLEENGKLNLVYASEEVLRHFKIRKKGYTYTAFSKRKAFVVYAKEYVRVHPELLELGIQSAILIPLFYKNRQLGALGVFSTRSDAGFTNKELNILKLFGSMATLAIRKTQLYDETHKALESRDMFLSMAAHEFRTPITTIAGYAQMLRLRLIKLKEDHDTEKRWTEEIYTETIRLSRLVGELLEVNRISSGLNVYKWQEPSLKVLLNRAVSNFNAARPQYKIKLLDNLNGADQIVADSDKLLQVFVNILDNAAKFSSSDKEITIELKDKGDIFSINIRDQGLGIPKNERANIFKGYYRGTNNQKEGMGLGLYISKEIIEKHKGTIRVKSKINQGTNMEIRLPKLAT